MKRQPCRSWTIVSGVRIECMLERGHYETGITHHEAWSVDFDSHRPKRSQYHNRLLTWWSSNRSYYDVQREARQ